MITESDLSSYMNQLGSIPPDKWRESISYWEELLLHTQEQSLRQYEIILLYHCGNYYCRTKEFIKSHDYCQRGIILAQKSTMPEYTVRFEGVLGLGYYLQGKLNQALVHMQKSIKLSIRIGQESLSYPSRINTGVILLETQREEESLVYFETLEKDFLAEENYPDADQTLGVIYNNIAHCYTKLERKDEALKYLEKSVSFATENRTVGNSYLDMAMIYYDRKEYPLLKEVIAKARQVAEEQSAVLPISQIRFHFFDAVIAIKEGRITEAVALFKSFLTNKDYPALNLTIRSAHILQEYYETIHDFKSALYYQKEEMNLRIHFQKEKLDKAVATAVLNFRLAKTKKENSDLNRMNRQMATINYIGQQVTASDDVDEIFNIIYSGFKKIFKFDSFGIALVDQEREEISYSYYFKNGTPITRKSFSLDSPDRQAAKAIREGQVLYSDEDCALYIPLIKDRVSFGCITLKCEEGNQCNRDDISLAESLTSFVSIALTNALSRKALNEAHEQIHFMAMHDTLTGLPNRNLLDSHLEQEMARASREDSNIGFIFFDLDRFKPINDRWGHEAGDVVLKEVAKRIKKSLRGQDLVCRQGGDEFIAVLSQISLPHDLEEVGAKIQEEIEKPITYGNKILTVGTSYGWSVFPDEGTDMEVLLHLADERMYSFKKKNRE